jgi:pimeloyl-ACP methyl ester carboxylesterase
VRYILDFRGADVDGPVLPGRLVRGTNDQLRAESQVAFLLHGFNVSRGQGEQALDRLADELPSAQAGAVVLTLWPGDHWIGSLCYPFEGSCADDTAAELARYVGDVIVPGTPLVFVAHSLGSRVAMETVARLLAGEYPVNQICLMAPAIDDFSLASPATYMPAARYSRRVAVLSSKRDKVLKYAYPLGDLLQSFIFFWRDEFGLALGFHGPKPCGDNPVPSTVIHHAIPDSRNAGHGDCIPSPAPTPEQLSATRFADDVIRGATDPQYP